MTTQSHAVDDVVVDEGDVDDVTDVDDVVGFSEPEPPPQATAAMLKLT